MKVAASLSGLIGLVSLGCAGAPAAPFDTLKTANVSAFRLQNFEPPAAPAGPAAPTPQQGMIPGLPPEISQWAQQALPGLQQLLPPGLLPPGLVPGMQQPQQAPPPPQNAPRFPMSQPNFRILGQAQVIDPALKEQLGKLLGDADSFQPDHGNCMYAEMGLSFSSPGGPLNDMLISFSCNQVEARSFAWPHANRGLKPETVKQLDALVQKIWPMG
jgi:hypothetical protein